VTRIVAETVTLPVEVQVAPVMPPPPPLLLLLELDELELLLELEELELLVEDPVFEYEQ
jgi:hypothetical protein